MSDTIGNMLTQIRNGQRAYKESVSFSFSNIKYVLAKVLEKEGYLLKIEKKGKAPTKKIKILLKYEQGLPKIRHISRVSRPGQRIYRGKDKLPRVLQGYGMAVISTPRGLMTDRRARKEGLGGEVICKVW